MKSSISIQNPMVSNTCSGKSSLCMLSRSWVLMCFFSYPMTFSCTRSSPKRAMKFFTGRLETTFKISVSFSLSAWV